MRFQQSNFIEIALRHECSSVNLQHIFRISFPKNTSGRLLLKLNKIRLQFHYLNFTIGFLKALSLLSEYSNHFQNTTVGTRGSYIQSK